jgi:imidazolonepropionase-like amidohydrolase
MSRALDRPREYHGDLGPDASVRYHARACHLVGLAGTDHRDTDLDGLTDMPAPDLVLHGGAVVTLDRASRVAEAIAVSGGRIAVVGPSLALLRETGSDTGRIDLRGRAVLPGYCTDRSRRS